MPEQAGMPCRLVHAPTDNVHGHGGSGPDPQRAPVCDRSLGAQGFCAGMQHPAPLPARQALRKGLLLVFKHAVCACASQQTSTA